MFHLFGRTYLEHDVFYNTKYAAEVISSVEKPHPISEKLGATFGTIPAFNNFLKTNFKDSVEYFWAEQLKESAQKKKIIFADRICYHQLLIQYWKSIFASQDVNSLYELYKLHICDTDIKLVMNIDRADNFKRLRPGELPALSYEEFAKIYEDSKEINCLRFSTKEDFSFEYLLAEYFIDKNGSLTGTFLKKLRMLCWRTWLSDIYSLRNEFLGSYFQYDKDLAVKSYIESNKLTSWMLDDQFNENNIEYIRKKYSPDTFIGLYESVNGNSEISSANVWESFSDVTRSLFAGHYLELLDEDIRQKRGCTFLRDHLSNEANQILASRIYEDVRLNNLEQLNKLKLA